MYHSPVDVQIAATQITQYATHVLSVTTLLFSSFTYTRYSSVFQAVNEPLQERGNILDLDFTRANAFPDDYDTDLESEWSNHNELFLFNL